MGDGTPRDVVDICRTHESGAPHGYHIAGVTLRSTFPLPPLRPFSCSPPPPVAKAAESSTVCPGSGDHARARGWLAGAWRDVDLQVAPGGFRIAIPEIGEFDIDGDGSRITLVETRADPSGPEFCETLLGPVLVVTLALRGVWCLHASAVRVGGAAVLFVGESGAGKSTLARHLSRLCDERLADDILPVTLVRGRPTCLPRFPQLGLQPEAHCLVTALPLRAIYQLNEAPCTRLQRCDASRAALVWIRHTVAARLFPRALLKAQFEFAAQLSAIPVFAVDYPHRDGSLDWLAAQIDAHGSIAA